MERQELENMSVKELRDKARVLRSEGHAMFTSVSGLAIAGMTKDEIISRMTGTYVENVPEPQPQANNNNGNGHHDSELIDVLARALGGKIQAQGIDESAVKAIVDSMLINSKKETKEEINELNERIDNTRGMLKDELDKLTKRIANSKKEITVTLPDATSANVGVQHEIFETLLKMLALRKHIFLVGPSGSGKTHIAEALAKALKVNYHFMLVGPETSKADFFGFKSMGNGDYHGTPFFEAYTKGGLILIDEIDAGHGGVMTMLNAALDNGICTFPCGTFTRHKDFMCIASGNTYGRGGDRVYVGRNALDGATLQRFKVIPMDYDEKLELALCPDENWVKKIHILRQVIAEHKAKIIVSMRPIIEGYELKQTGFKEDDILDMTVFQGYNTDAVSAIKRDLKARCK